MYVVVQVCIFVSDLIQVNVCGYFKFLVKIECEAESFDQTNLNRRKLGRKFANKHIHHLYYGAPAVAPERRAGVLLLLLFI